ncbi:sensor histidine kinase [Legionella donaldsonii]|uniref:diguanylate cyclase n=1 Tax=Legionella donaldsonii TaxID=45060 RepID=A0A378J2G1_9GAMM|nr:diguanylate cyclase [Legionella donaldsonii]STX41805.1 sensor histidine kinase [Legionella donaldsonii]
MKNFNQRVLLNLFLLILFFLQIGVNVSSYVQIQHLLNAKQWVLHTQELISAINDLWGNILEISVYTRGYVITGDANSVQALNNASAAASTKVQNLKRLIKDNPKQLERLNHLSTLLKERIHFSNSVIAIYQKKGEEAAEDLLTKQRGALLHQLQTVIFTMINTEKSLLNARDDELQKTSDTALSYIKMTNTLTFVLFFLFLGIFNIQFSRTVKLIQRRKQAEDQLKGIISGTNDSIAAIDNNYNLIAFNPSYAQDFLQLFGKSISLGDNLNDLLQHLPAEQTNLITLWKKALSNKKFSIIEELGDSKLTRNSYEITYSPIHNADNILIGASQIARNVTERLKIEKEMERANAQLTKNIEETRQRNHAVYLLNQLSSTLQMCLNVEETLEPIAMYGQKILPTTAGSLYLAHPSKNYMDCMTGWGKPIIEEKIIGTEQCWAIRRGQIYHYYNSGQSIPCQHVKAVKPIPCYVCIPLQAQNENIGLLYLEFLNSQDLNEKEFRQLVENHEQLIISIAESIALSLSNIKLHVSIKMRSIRDPLTNLYNRSYLEEFFSRELQRAKRQNNNLAIVMMDLDHFKKVNDTYGHEAGDIVLIEVANLLARNIRETDIVCRYGGEEILLLLVEVNSAEEVYERIDQLRQEIGKLEISFQGKLLERITASFGIAMMPEHADTQSALIEIADRALYQAKKQGRNKVVYYKKT